MHMNNSIGTIDTNDTKLKKLKTFFKENETKEDKFKELKGIIQENKEKLYRENWKINSTFLTQAQIKEIYTELDEYNEINDRINNEFLSKYEPILNKELIHTHTHIIKRREKNKVCFMNRFNKLNLIFPMFTFNHILWTFENLKEVTLWKSLYTLITMVLVSLFGTFNILIKAIVILTIISFAMRGISNKYIDSDKKISPRRNILKFTWTYVLLCIFNILNEFVALNGLPEDTLLCLGKTLLIWMELKEIFGCAKIANLPVPKQLLLILNIDETQIDKFFPF